MSNILEFPGIRITSGTHVKQVLRRARELADLRDVVAQAGLSVGDRVQHTTYLWEGKITAFDWKDDGMIATHCMVEADFDGRTKTIAVEIDLLRYLGSAGAAC